MAFHVYAGDVLDSLDVLESGSVDCCVTSPPYWGLRDYGVAGQIGLEATPEEYVSKMVEVFGAVRRVLRDDGTLWLNLGDSYWSDTLSRKDPVESMWGNRPASDLAAGRDNIPKNNRRGGLGARPPGLKQKDMVGIPWRVAFALQADGWYLRSDIIWHKPNPMPESVQDRPTKAHEYIFLLSKSAKYYYDNEAIAEDLNYPNETRRPLGSKGAWQMDGREQRDNGGGSSYGGYPVKRNKRSVWTVTTQPYPEAHFATYPEKLIEPCVLAGCPQEGVVLDPFLGSGTTGAVAVKQGKSFIGIEINPEYIELAKKRISKETDNMFCQEKLEVV